jgi:hypothetical protein
MAKGASSAMTHLERRRNSNELYGAYGHNLTWDEMVWLANWAFVRGHNLLMPHAFYYSVRGPRYEERPPDVGPNAEWWGKEYKSYADACRRLSWLNTDSRHICNIAILGNSTYLPYRAARICFQNQFDFNYLETRHLWEDAKVDKEGIHLAGMNYKVVILDSLIYLQEEAIPVLRELENQGRLVVWGNSRYAELFNNALHVASASELPAYIETLVEPDIILTPSSNNIRYRHVIKGNYHYYILFNEEETAADLIIDIPARGRRWWLDPFTAGVSEVNGGNPVHFEPYELKIMMVGN